MKVGIIDYGAGNMKSVQNALERLGVEYVISDDIEVLKKVQKIIFPGVGHARTAMQKLREKGLDTFLSKTKQPILGICLGMQLLFESTEEGDTKGLGIIPGEVKAFDARKVPKIPHMGWNEISGEVEGFVYFVHSYFVPISEYTTIKSAFGDQEFSSAIKKEKVVGMQFHPEKSGDLGQQILHEFLTNPER